MKIRAALPTDLEQIINIYSHARRFMSENANPDQWGDSYPSKEIITADLEGGHLFVLVDDDNALAGVFSCFIEGDPDYDVINGAWLNDEPYTAIHRIASAGTHKGVFSHILDYCRSFSKNIKIDTYKDNHIMQALLKKHGFEFCGTITVEGVDDMEFIAFQLVNKE